MIARLQQLVELRRERQALTTPIEAQIEALQAEMAARTADLDAQIQQLETAARLEVLTHGQTVRLPGITASYQVRRSWDTEGLLTLAEEVPAVTKYLTQTDMVVLRYRK